MVNQQLENNNVVYQVDFRIPFKMRSMFQAVIINIVQPAYLINIERFLTILIVIAKIIMGILLGCHNSCGTCANCMKRMHVQNVLQVGHLFNQCIKYC
ncbi:unnamed protein product [Paramecium octaurelia]|nr:unnamed protein product [Paramecium octaurelia]